MRRLDMETLALRLAEALLLYKGELSIRDIEALPFLEDPKDAELIAMYLRNKFKARISTLKSQQQEIGGWEDLITLVE